MEVGRVCIYLMYSDLQGQPFALIEDVYVDETYRSKGLGAGLVEQVVELAQKVNCYKLIANSRISISKADQGYTTWQLTDRERKEK